MSLIKNILYINLENRPDRNTHALQELSKLGITPTRINAVKNTSGALGCTLSHIKSIEYAKKNNFKEVFICEDDITFLNPQLLLENLNKMEKNADMDWDVLIIGGNNCPPYQKITDYCIRIYNNQTTTGYIVRSHYYDILIKNMKESAKQLMIDPQNKQQYAIDMYWKSLQRSGKWYMIIPPTVIQYEDYSDIERRVVNYKDLMLDLDKEWLFRGRSFFQKKC
jgi:GR25 family glycosyltransferase involved in LPS biosynthesis